MSSENESGSDWYSSPPPSPPSFHDDIDWSTEPITAPENALRIGRLENRYGNIDFFARFEVSTDILCLAQVVEEDEYYRVWVEFENSIPANGKIPSLGIPLEHWEIELEYLDTLGRRQKLRRERIVEECIRLGLTG